MALLLCCMKGEIADELGWKCVAFTGRGGFLLGSEGII